MRFGAQSATFVSITEDLDQRDENNDPLIVRTETVVKGVRFRPMTAKEQFERGLNTVVDPWKLTAPPVPAVVGATSTGEVIVDGVAYQIVGGPRTFPDASGVRPFKTTILCERQDG